MGMIQIRNVPDDVHRELKARAAKKGMSLSDYLLRDLLEQARRPTMDEMFERLSKLEPAQTTESVVDMLSEEREARTDDLLAVLAEADRRSRESE